MTAKKKTPAKRKPEAKSAPGTHIPFGGQETNIPMGPDDSPWKSSQNEHVSVVTESSQENVAPRDSSELLTSKKIDGDIIDFYLNLDADDLSRAAEGVHAQNTPLDLPPAAQAISLKLDVFQRLSVFRKGLIDNMNAATLHRLAIFLGYEDPGKIVEDDALFEKIVDPKVTPVFERLRQMRDAVNEYEEQHHKPKFKNHREKLEKRATKVSFNGFPATLTDVLRFLTNEPDLSPTLLKKLLVDAFKPVCKPSLGGRIELLFTIVKSAEFSRGLDQSSGPASGHDDKTAANLEKAAAINDLETLLWLDGIVSPYWKTHARNYRDSTQEDKAISETKRQGAKGANDAKAENKWPQITDKCIEHFKGKRLPDTADLRKKALLEFAMGLPGKGDKPIAKHTAYDIVEFLGTLLNHTDKNESGEPQEISGKLETLQKPRPPKKPKKGPNKPPERKFLSVTELLLTKCWKKLKEAGLVSALR